MTAHWISKFHDLSSNVVNPPWPSRWPWKGIILTLFCSSAAAIPFLGNKPARAVPIDYTIDVTFSSPTGGLSGSFSLDGGDDCRVYNSSNTSCGWTLASTNKGGYFYQSLTNVDVDWNYDNFLRTANGAIPALYGYTADGVYFLQFIDEGNDEFLNAFMETPLPGLGSSIALTDSIAGNDNTYSSAICTLELPPPANVQCPGQGNNTIFLTFGASNVSAVPAPLGPALLLPAAFLTGLRQRYRKQSKKCQSPIEPVAEGPAPASAVGICGK